MFIAKKKIVKTITIIFLLFMILAVYQSNFVGRMMYPFPYKQTVEKYAAQYGMDPLLVIAVIREESRFITKSKSSKGAVGLMQLMPGTAKEVAVWLKEDYAKADLLDPETNIRYGTWYLASLSKEFSGNTVLTLAAYNAGIGRVQSWLDDWPKDPNAYRIEEIPITETREYVEKVYRSYEKYLALYATQHSGGRE